MGNTPPGKYNAKTTAWQVVKDLDLRGRYIAITGCNTGIGKEAARVLVLRGATIIMACRNSEAAEAARQDIIADAKKKLLKAEGEAPPPAPADVKGKGKQPPVDPETITALPIVEENEQAIADRIICIPLDLNSLKSVEQFAEEYLGRGYPLHVLINNAGIMALPTFQTTADGYEKQWGVNHLGHFHLTRLLLPRLLESAPSRVVCLSSRAHEDGGSRWPFNIENLPPKPALYNDWKNYGCSKLSNILFAKELNEKYHEQGVTAYAVHPGVIPTELGRNNGLANFFYKIASAFIKTIPQGAATTVYCTTEDNIKGGGYFWDCAEQVPSKDAQNPTFAHQLWELSDRLIEETRASWQAKEAEPKKEEGEAKEEAREEGAKEEHAEASGSEHHHHKHHHHHHHHEDHHEHHHKHDHAAEAEQKEEEKPEEEKEKPQALEEAPAEAPQEEEVAEA